jgi:hypothetical protein
MYLATTLPADFKLCPPLDYPLRLAFEFGYYGAPRIQGSGNVTCCSDHFLSITPDGSSGLHQIHEGVDLASSAGSCVFAAYGGTIVDKRAGKLVIDHQGTGEAYASQYLHIDSGPKGVGDQVIKGEPIAAVKPHHLGDHLHFELWHWVHARPHGNPDTEAVPIDPTRLLYHWEQALAMSYATLGQVDMLVSSDLDNGIFSGDVEVAYSDAEIELPSSAVVEILARTCTWRVRGDDTTHLLRVERGAITVFQESYGSYEIAPDSIDRISLSHRWSYPTFLVECDNTVYGIPLHKPSKEELMSVDMIRQAFEHRHPVKLEVRSSAFWSMDGARDEVSGLITGVSVG